MNLDAVKPIRRYFVMIDAQDGGRAVYSDYGTKAEAEAVAAGMPEQRGAIVAHMEFTGDRSENDGEPLQPADPDLWREVEEK